MKFLKTYFLIIVGAIILVFANTETLKMPYIYIAGIVFLMFGLFNISRIIRSKEEIKDVEFNDEEE